MIDRNKLRNLKEFLEIKEEEFRSILCAKEKLRKAKKQYSDLKIKGKECREKDLLDLRPNEITEENL